MDVTPGNPTRGDLHICAGQDAKAVYVVEDDTPMLALGSGTLAFTVGIGCDGSVSERHVMFVRELAAACQEFVRAVESLHEWQQNTA